MRTAHITSRPNHQVGDKVLGLCGEEFKVRVIWADIPDDHPICRPCVDVALGALTEADLTIEASRLWLDMVQSRVRRLDHELNPEQDSVLDQITAADHELRERQEAKADLKAAEKRAKATCTCTWTDADKFSVNESCPIHGSK